ncbi:MAG: nuclear transport factor 2 family protein [Pirellulaceae bacterium]
MTSNDKSTSAAQVKVISASAPDLVAEIVARELDLMRTKNRPEFFVDPKILLEFYDVERIREFDISAPFQLEGNDYVEMLVRVAPEYVGEASIHDLRIECCGDVAFTSLVERYVGHFRANGAPFDLAFRMTHGWKKTRGLWKLLHEHMSFPVDAEGKPVMSTTFPLGGG